MMITTLVKELIDGYYRWRKNFFPQFERVTGLKCKNFDGWSNHRINAQAGMPGYQRYNEIKDSMNKYVFKGRCGLCGALVPPHTTEDVLCSQCQMMISHAVDMEDKFYYVVGYALGFPSRFVPTFVYKAANKCMMFFYAHLYTFLDVPLDPNLIAEIQKDLIRESDKFPFFKGYVNGGKMKRFL